jgi:hypothetical protein
MKKFLMIGAMLVCAACQKGETVPPLSLPVKTSFQAPGEEGQDTWTVDQTVLVRVYHLTSDKGEEMWMDQDKLFEALAHFNVQLPKGIVAPAKPAIPQ